MHLAYPTPQEVLAHGFDFRPRWWQSRAPRNWASFLSDLPAAEQGREYRHITRAVLFAKADDQSPDGTASLLLACYVWGTGNSGWLVPRRARIFRDTEPSLLRRRLTDARRLLYSSGPQAAYISLADGGPNRIKHMRASFFTKFLYAADARGGRAHGQALILDQFVAIALNDLHNWGLPERGPWSPEVYQRWIEHADREARARSDGTRSVRPDAVEMAYFQHGRRLPQARLLKG